MSGPLGPGVRDSPSVRILTGRVASCSQAGLRTSLHSRQWVGTPLRLLPLDTTPPRRHHRREAAWQPRSCPGAALAEAHRAVNATGNIDVLSPVLPAVLGSRCVGLGLYRKEVHVQIRRFTFGSIQIGGVTYQYDVVIEGGQVRKRKKKASRRLRAGFGHTPLSADEDIPWTCRRLVIGTGAYGALPVMPEVTREARRRKVELVILATPDAIKILRKGSEQTNAILHVTC